MKRAIAVAVLALAAVSVARGQDIAGDWQGDLPIGMGSIRIVLHITKAGDGTFKAILDSPDQNITGMAVDSFTLDGKKLKFSVSASKGSYEGAVKNASTITGNWTQPNKTPLDFKKTTTPIKTEHPPAPPSDIDGIWEGAADLPSLQGTPANGKLRLAFHVKNTGDGLTATMDVPDQDIKGWPAVAVTRKGSSIKIDAPQIGGAFIGKLNKDLSAMSGDWTTEHTYALTLRRAKEAPAGSQK